MHTIMRIAASWALAAVLAAGTAAAAGAVELKANGLHHQPWITDISSAPLHGTRAQVNKAGKHLVLLVEQKGCEYCKQLHEVNFTIPELVRTITDNFKVLQVDMWGDAQVAVAPGEKLSQRAFTESLGVTNTPTTLFLGADGKEIFRLPGYIGPFIYRSAFEYVADGAPSRQIKFVPWLKERRRKRQARGAN